MSFSSAAKISATMANRAKPRKESVVSPAATAGSTDVSQSRATFGPSRRCCIAMSGSTSPSTHRTWSALEGPRV